MIIRPNENKTNYRLIMGLISVIIAGICLFIYTGRNIYLSYEVKKWPTVQGTIIAFSYDKMDTDGSTSYFLHVEYTYVVNDAKFKSKQFAFGLRGSMKKEWLDEGVKSFNEGNREVLVHYDPKDPSNAVLFTGDTLFANISMLIFGLILLLEVLLFIIHKNDPSKG